MPLSAARAIAFGALFWWPNTTRISTRTSRALECVLENRRLVLDLRGGLRNSDVMLEIGGRDF